MHIVFFAKYINASGVSIHMHDLAVEYIKKGHEVTIISAGPNSKDAKEIYENYKEIGVYLENIPLPLKTTTVTRAYKEIFLYLISLKKGLKVLKKISPDIIHVHWGVTSYIPYYYKKITNVPFVHTAHLAKFPRSFLHKKADGYIAISSELESEIKAEIQGAETRKIFNGSNSQIFKPIQDKNELTHLKDEFGISHDKLIIGFVGSIEPRKGLDILLEAISKEMVEKYNIDILILGSGDKKYLKCLIAKNRLEGNVKHFEFQDPKNLYRVMDVFILPSRREGFGLVCTEAMLSGVPVLRTNTEGAYDQITQGKDGYICQSEKPDDLRKYLLKLLSDEGLRKKIGKNGRETALKNFTKEIMAEKTLTFYKDIIEQNKTVLGR
jgi:glycosyltransferase involved in cell wall biosynthesis